jgi:hypothetical protein
MDAIARYPGLDAYYDADQRRRRSNETDFGTTWRDGIATSAIWRLSWVEATGEVYAHELSPAGVVVVLATCLRRPVVEQLLDDPQPDHALARAWSTLQLPALPAGWSGFVALHGAGARWVAERGWWARPLASTTATATAAGTATATAGARAHGDLVSLGEAILADRGWPSTRSLARQLARDVLTGHSTAGSTRVPAGEVAAWMARTGPYLGARDDARRSA